MHLVCGDAGPRTLAVDYLSLRTNKMIAVVKYAPVRHLRYVTY